MSDGRRDAARLLDALAISADVPGLVLEPAGDTFGVADANRGSLVVLERSADEVVGRGLAEVFAPTVADDLTKLVADAAEADRPLGRRIALPRTGDRDPLVLMASVAPLPGSRWLVTFKTVQTTGEVDGGRQVGADDLIANLKELARVTTASYTDLDDLLRAYLAAGCRILGLDLGIVSHIVDERYLVRAVHGGGDAVAPNAEFELAATYCAAVAATGRTTVYSHVGSIVGMRDHPAYLGMALESYIGVPLYVGGEMYGTVNFSSARVRNTGFQQHEIDIIEVMADSIGRLLRTREIELERARERRELARMARQLEERNRELETFASVAAHDLKSPLASVRGFAQTLELHGRDLGESEREWLSHIVTTSDRMAALIEDLLALAQAAGGELAVEEIELRETVEHVVDALRHVVDEAGATVVHTDLPRITASPRMMDQLFTNLIGNAVKYRREEVPVRIEIRGEPAEAPTGDDADTTWYRITVSDNGRGFDDEQLERLFAAFDRLDQTDVGGTGVGLPICRRIVERHGGSIDAHGVPGEGATFTILLPSAPVRPPATAPRVDPP